MTLNDQDLRRVLLEELYLQYKDDKNTRIINELGIDHGASRVDVAVVNGIIHGYEIKSDVDNLYRLPRQISYYNKLFQRMTIVTTKKYYLKVREMVPPWWGILIISNDGSRLICKRKGRYRNQQDKKILLKLLWKRDLEGLVDYANLPKSLKKKRKHYLLNYFEEYLDIKEVQNFVYTILKNRDYSSSTVNLKW